MSVKQEKCHINRSAPVRARTTTRHYHLPGGEFLSYAEMSPQALGLSVQLTKDASGLKRLVLRAKGVNECPEYLSIRQEAEMSLVYDVQTVEIFYNQTSEQHVLLAPGRRSVLVSLPKDKRSFCVQRVQQPAESRIVRSRKLDNRPSGHCHRQSHSFYVSVIDTYTSTEKAHAVDRPHAQSTHAHAVPSPS
ncbi:hypothetical protein BaRGS_00010715 [Batillaria attramentaria]|uniref:Uncharacterized protein n=1 Tax=Batillaria attramentaria TaxID=370345 RepID=A0ABD0LFL7_9CAEN